MIKRIGEKSVIAILTGGIILGAILFAGTVGVLQLMSVISLTPLVLTGALIAAAAVGAGDGFPFTLASLLAAEKCYEKCNKRNHYESL